ncbi:CLAVATA3/ESR (CLE)-related protein 12 [Raphanus sativus]|nr:CLAVATA3/ESR (CLE)-related protein 12 [Raphanus sativus]
MALKFFQILLRVLWLSLSFLLLHHLYYVNLHRLYSLNVEEPSVLKHHDHRRLYTINRLVSSRKAPSHSFDFTPFQHRQNNHHQPRSDQGHGGDEIDPRYGVEKRRVPSGPNPLHH